MERYLHRHGPPVTGHKKKIEIDRKRFLEERRRSKQMKLYFYKWYVFEFFCFCFKWWLVNLLLWFNG